MTLEMKTKCERCEQKLKHESNAFICSYECTFCDRCAEETARKCPNCSGELTARPRRKGKPN